MLLILLLIRPQQQIEHEHERIRIRIKIRSKKKPEPLSQFGLQNYYPADAVKADIPFPFGNGRTTVAGASDFQLRHVIFPKCNQASWSMKYRFGNHTCNLEHRRVNC